MTDWKYCFPHTWDQPRQAWEDVYLLPDDTSFSGPALHLTVDALGSVSDPRHGSDRAAFQEIALTKLGNGAFWIEGGQMIVRQVDFTREDLLGWIRLWLERNGFHVGALREAPLDVFRERLAHATLIADLKDQLERNVN